MQLGTFITARRKKLGLTRQDLIARLSSHGVRYSTSALAWWETGRTNPPMHDRQFIEALAKALDMSIDSFLESIGLVDLDVSTLTLNERALLNAYRAGDLQEVIRILADADAQKN